MSNDDQFFNEYEAIGDFKFRFGITIKFNIVEIDFAVVNKNLGIKSGGGLGLIVQLMTDWKINTKKPGFSNEFQMKALLKASAIFYVDIKKEIVNKLT